jgi:dihydrodipicolinate synthase/N-acetylneuraminate lyase
MMDKLLGGLVLIVSAGVAVLAAKYGNRLVKKMEAEDIEKSKKIQEATEKMFEKVLKQTVQRSVDDAMSSIGFKNKFVHNNPR